MSYVEHAHLIWKGIIYDDGEYILADITVQFFQNGDITYLITLENREVSAHVDFADIDELKKLGVTVGRRTQLGTTWVLRVPPVPRPGEAGFPHSIFHNMEWEIRERDGGSAFSGEGPVIAWDSFPNCAWQECKDLILTHRFFEVRG